MMIPRLESLKLAESPLLLCQSRATGGHPTTASLPHPNLVSTLAQRTVTKALERRWKIKNQALAADINIDFLEHFLYMGQQEQSCLRELVYLHHFLSIMALRNIFGHLGKTRGGLLPKLSSWIGTPCQFPHCRHEKLSRAAGVRQAG